MNQAYGNRHVVAFLHLGRDGLEGVVTGTGEGGTADQAERSGKYHHAAECRSHDTYPRSVFGRGSKDELAQPIVTAREHTPTR
jgi:hypothetical protein